MTHTLDISLDTGLLQNPSFHDGYIVGLLVEQGKAAVLLRTVDGVPYRLDLLAVSLLVGNDFREGNIISRIQIIAGRQPEVSDLLPLFGELDPAVKEPYRQQYKDRVAKAAGRVAQGEASIVAIVPSYGCEFVALCEAVTLRPSHDDDGLSAG